MVNWHESVVEKRSEPGRKSKVRKDFCAAIKSAMEGRLEPDSVLFAQYQDLKEVTTMVDRLCGSFIELLKTSVAVVGDRNGDEISEDLWQKALDESDVLLKKHYWRKESA